MAGGYAHDPSGPEGINRRLRDLQRQIDQIRGSAGTNSAIVRGKLITFQSPDGDDTVTIGEHSDTRGLKVFDSTGMLLLSAWEWLPGNSLGAVGNIIQSGYPGGGPVDAYYVFGDLIQLDTTDLRLPSIPTTGLAANLVLDTGDYRLKRSTSSERYKDDIQDYVVDPAEVLATRIVSYSHKGEREADVEADKRRSLKPPFRADDRDGDQVAKSHSKARERKKRRYTGLLAEDLAARPTLERFVVYDDDQQPDSIQYDRFAAVGLLAVCRDQQERIESQQAEIDELKSTVAAMAKRLAALEARRA